MPTLRSRVATTLGPVVVTAVVVAVGVAAHPPGAPVARSATPSAGSATSSLVLSARGPAAGLAVAALGASTPDHVATWTRGRARTVAIRRAAPRRPAPRAVDLTRISADTDHGLPVAARRAYQAAARTMEQVRPGCDLPWELLAGIGRVESDHGRYGGSQLGVDGVPRPPIRGVALDGVGPVAAIADTDDGRLDGDRTWDRAVGPLQFIPSTWAVAGRDGDGDGRRDPDDLDDAALAAAYYLCPVTGSIRDDAVMRAQVFAYNHSTYYVDLVLAFATGYETGYFDLPSPPPEPDEPADPVKPVRPVKEDEPVEDAPDATPQQGPHHGPGGGHGNGHGGGHGNGHGNGGGHTPTPTPTPTPSPTPLPTPTPTPTPTPAPSPSAPSPSTPSPSAPSPPAPTPSLPAPSLPPPS